MIHHRLHQIMIQTTVTSAFPLVKTHLRHRWINYVFPSMTQSALSKSDVHTLFSQAPLIFDDMIKRHN